MMVVAFFAHPDDESLLAGATLAACAATGHRVVLVSATSGERGPRNSGESDAELARIRLAELDRAAAELGASAISLGLPDGALAELTPDAIAAAAARVVLPLQPHVLITFASDGLYGHPDHVAVQDAMALLRARLPDDKPVAVYHTSWPRGHLATLVAHMEARGLPHGTWGIDPSAFGAAADVDLREFDLGRYATRKLAALRCHESQLDSGHLFSALPDDLATTWLGREFFTASDNRSYDPLPGAILAAITIPSLAGSR